VKLILMVGLPRSGKSTWAMASGFPVVNPDSIRLAIHGQKFYAPAEPLVWSVAHVMVESLRIAGHATVVLDATNVTAKRRGEWTSIYPDHELHVVNTPPSTCVARAEAEGYREIIPVIHRMAKDWDLRGYWKGE
jgi:predicted kinase